MQYNIFPDNFNVNVFSFSFRSNSQPSPRLKNTCIFPDILVLFNSNFAERGLAKDE